MTRSSAVPVWVIGLLCLFVPPLVHAETASDGGVTQRQVVTGTLTKLDWTSGKGQVTTDLGKPIFFELTKPHLFQTLPVGTRITIEIDAYGRANKVINASVAEFPPPPLEGTDEGPPQPVGDSPVSLRPSGNVYFS